MLPHDEHGTGPRVVLAHGFGQDRRCWGSFAGRLAAAGLGVRTVDLPGHGDGGVPSGWADTVSALGATGGRADYVGYSMGGRISLALAVDRPDLVRRLVLIGASPGIADPAARAARRDRDEELAGEIEGHGVDRFVTSWLAQPMFAGLAPEVRFEAERRQQDPARLAAMLRSTGTGAQPPLWERLGAVACPALLVVGARDAKFGAIARAMAEQLVSARIEVVPDAGHAAHLEQPAVTASLVADFLAG